jgi:hypothetical protein
MFNVDLNPFQQSEEPENQRRANDSQSQVHTDSVPPGQSVETEEQSGIRLVDITPEPAEPEVEVVETGFGLLHLLLAALIGAILGVILTLLVLALVGPPGVPIVAGLEVIA